MTYDEQIAYLTENPDKISDQWMKGIGLFRILGPYNGFSGCLTTIRHSKGSDNVYINGKPDEMLAKEIAADERLPMTDTDITIESLPVFKEWQERIDKLQTQQL